MIFIIPNLFILIKKKKNMKESEELVDLFIKLKIKKITRK